MHARITGWSRAVSVMLLTSLCLACMGGGVREAKPEVVVEKQSSIAGLYKVEAMSGSASEHPRVTFSQVGQVELPADDKRITTWWKMLEHAKDSGGAVFVEQSATGKIERILLPSKKKVEAVAQSPEGDRLKVTLYMAPSLYFIRTTSPRYSVLRQLLASAASSRSEVLVVNDPATLEILYVESAASVNAD